MVIKRAAAGQKRLATTRAEGELVAPRTVLSSSMRDNLAKNSADVVENGPILIEFNGAPMAELTAKKPSRACIGLGVDEARKQWRFLLNTIENRGARVALTVKGLEKPVYLRRLKSYQNPIVDSWRDLLQSQQTEVSAKAEGAPSHTEQVEEFERRIEQMQLALEKALRSECDSLRRILRETFL